MKNIWQVAFEALPFVKVGGLADMVYGLSTSLRKTEKVSVFLPMPSKLLVHHSLRKTTEFSLPFLGTNEKIFIYQAEVNEVDYFLIDNLKYFSREEVYGHSDDRERYCLFCLAIAHYMQSENKYPDILQMHDYHVAPLAALCRYGNQRMSRLPLFLTIHNFHFQGQYTKDTVTDMLSLPVSAYEEGVLRYGDGCNFLKIGLVLADEIITVSETYRQELLSSNEKGMYQLLRERKDHFHGILNGILLAHFPRRCTVDSMLSYKKERKLSFQEKMHLTVDENVFAVAFVARLSNQKGIAYMLKSRLWLEDNVQLWLVGKGEKKYEKAFSLLAKMYPQKIVYKQAVDEVFARKVYEAADLFLMPSLWEPCGMAQMIAMHYGTLPLIRLTGGLKESVCANELRKSNGFGFDSSLSEFTKCFREAKSIYEHRREEYQEMQKRAFLTNVSFERAAEKYRHIYRGYYESI